MGEGVEGKTLRSLRLNLWFRNRQETCLRVLCRSQLQRRRLLLFRLTKLADHSDKLFRIFLWRQVTPIAKDNQPRVRHFVPQTEAFRNRDMPLVFPPHHHPLFRDPPPTSTHSFSPPTP